MTGGNWNVLRKVSDSRHIPDPSSSRSSSPSQGAGLAKLSTLAEGTGIQHFNSGSAYSMIRPGVESEARHPSGPNRSPFDQYARSTWAGPCSDERIVTRIRFPFFGALAMWRHRFCPSIIFIPPSGCKCHLAMKNVASQTLRNPVLVLPAFDGMCRSATRGHTRGELERDADIRLDDVRATGPPPE